MNKTAECVRTVANWSRSQRSHLFDSATFDEDELKTLLPEAGPKLQALLDNIEKLDAADMKMYKTQFKHMIYTDVKAAPYGSKLIAGAMVAHGYHHIYDKSFKLDEDALPMSTGSKNFATICSTTIFKKPLGVRFRKKILALFNERPENVHGEKLRFVILDQGFKEGIDLYDVKYVHLLDPLVTQADEKQAVGRSTRFCGQKGLTFDPNLGWPLHVYRYEVDLPKDLQDTLDSTTMFDLFLKTSGLDMRKVVFANALEQLGTYGAVDADLNKSVHSFRQPVQDDAKAKNSILDRLPTAGLRSLLHLTEGGARKKKKKASKLPPNAPRTKKSFEKMREYIQERFAKFTWPEAKMENQCVARLDVPTKNKTRGDTQSEQLIRAVTPLSEERARTVGGAPQLVSFTPTQDFVRYYFTPSSAYKGLLLWHSVGAGKCHAKDTPILMYDGTIKMVQDVQVGDLLMGDDSTPRKVLTLARGRDDMYDIIPVKGDKYTVNSEHILCLRPTKLGIKHIPRQTNLPYTAPYFNLKTGKINGKSFATREEANAFQEGLLEQDNVLEIAVKDYLKLSKTSRSQLKGYRTGVDYPRKEVHMDPYILGYWLGDGSQRDPVISTADEEVLQYFRTTMARYDLDIRHQSKYDYRISSRKPGVGSNHLLNMLQKYKLINNKHIPHDYKANDRHVRLELLAGLIDSDGYAYRKTGYDIIQKNKQLANDIVFLCRSLGYAAYMNECKKSCTYKGKKKEGTYHRISISGQGLEEIPVKLARKKVTSRQIKKDALVTGIDVKHVGKGTYYGFTLDGNNRYLLGDFTVTHNTCTAIATATSSFEPKGYSILWVTRHTLKADIWKNMFQQVCSLVLKREIRHGRVIPDNAVNQPKRNLSKNWLLPISFKQFSNALEGKNDIYHELVRRNGAEDPLRKTLVIIDEAHKLFATDVSKMERPNLPVIYHKVHASYEISKEDSARILLMTATPYTSDPMQFIQLLNLLRPKEEAITEDFPTFAEQYLTSSGTFSKEGTNKFLDDIAGYISYLNRAKDARQFAVPEFHNIHVPLSRSDGRSKAVRLEKMKAEMADFAERVQEGEKAVRAAKAKMKAELQQKLERCKTMPKGQKVPCAKAERERMKAFEENLLGDLQKKLDADEAQMKQRKKIAKDLARDIKDNKKDRSQEAALASRCKLDMEDYEEYEE